MPEKRKKKQSVVSSVSELLGIPLAPEQRQKEKAKEEFQKQLDKVPMVPIKRLKDWVDETIAVGRRLKIPDMVIGDMMRPVMRAAGYSYRSIVSTLPDGFKREYESAKIAHSDTDDDEIWQINPADYSLDDLDRYDKPFLIAVIKYLHKVVNGVKPIQ